MQVRRMKTLSIVEQEVAEFGFANAHGIRKQGLEYWL